jgi:hypothetical protein
MKLDGIGLATTLIGGVLVYSGARGYSALTVVGNLVLGKPVATDTTVTNPLSTPGKADTSTAVPDYNVQSPRATGQSMAAAMGWTGEQWTALEQLWTHESGWNNRAKNPSSGAYGIPQALPYSKMPKAAWPETAGGTSDIRTQVQWGLTYIKGRYGTPVMAWAFWQRQSPHWY